MPSTRKRAPARSSRGRSTARAKTRTRASASWRATRGRGLPLLGSLLPQRFSGFGPLDQRGRDVLGLALVAIGVFMGFVLPAGRPLLREARTIGAICLFAGITLALAAGAFGITSSAHGIEVA